MAKAAAAAPAKKSTAASPTSTGVVKKKMSPYNAFMKTELPKVKKANPAMSHKDAFKMAASHWKTAAENTKK